MSDDSIPDTPPTDENGVPLDTATFDPRLAAYTFEALERVTCLAAAEDELDVAADYADSLFTLADQLPEFFNQFFEESLDYALTPQGEEYEQNVERQMRRIEAWANENDHPVAEWFDAPEE